MADQVSLTSPVTVVSDSKQRVALDLTSRIDSYSDLDRKQKDRKYWLTLYCQCYKAVDGCSIGAVLKED